MTAEANPTTEEYRCVCGESFDTPAELANHEVECRAARGMPDADRIGEERPVQTPADDEEPITR